MLKPWTGPFKIIRQIGPVDFLIKDMKTGQAQLVHANRLKLCLPIITDEEYEARRAKSTTKTPDLHPTAMCAPPPLPEHLNPPNPPPPPDPPHPSEPPEQQEQESSSSSSSETLLGSDSDFQSTDNNSLDSPPASEETGKRYQTRSSGPAPDLP